MGTKHTPGPWNYVDEGGRGQRLTFYTGMINTSDARPLGLVEGFSRANARLIAAAPEMLEIVRRAANIPEMLEIELTLSDDARALLAKIKGEE